MTFFGQFRGDLNPLFLIFLLISVVYFINGIRLFLQFWPRREEFGREPLTLWKQQWSERAAFLLAVPLGVFIHELFHAIPVWMFGGTVVDVGYGFYWGYVSHSGSYQPWQLWFISLAGTLGTLVYAGAIWLVLRNYPSTPWRYFGLRTLRFHLYYALIYYPVFTLLTFIGDWRTIYNFGATPILSSVTLVVHAAMLYYFWRLDHEGAFELPTVASPGQQAQFDALRAHAEASPEDIQLQLQYVDALRRSGARNEARQRLDQLVREHPRSAEGHLLLGMMEAENRAMMPRKAREHLETALQLGLAQPAQRAVAYGLLAQHYLRVEKVDEALRYLDEAIATDGNGQVNKAYLYFLRAQAQRRQGKYPAASQDIEEAIALARKAGDEGTLAQYENERRTIRHHLGR